MQELKKMKNKLNIILACFWLVIALFFGWILYSKLSDRDSGFHFRINWNDGIYINLGDLSVGDLNTLYKSYSFSTADVESFNVDMVAVSVHFMADKGSDISVELYGNWNETIEPEVKTEHSTLKIKTPNITIRNWGSLGSRKVVIKVPESALSTLFNADVSTVSGSFHSTDVAFNRLSVDSTSGSVHFDGCVERFTADTVSGSVHVNGTCRNICANSTSGSIHVETDEPLEGRNVFDSTSGSVHLTIPEESGFELEWDTVSGSVNNEFYRGKCGKSGSFITGDGEAEIRLETVSGSIHLNKN